MTVRLLLFAWFLVAAAGTFGPAALAAEPQPGEISAEFAMPLDRVRQLHEREKLSYEEIRTALILSRETGVSLDEIVGLHRAGVSFEDIAARHRLDLDEVLSSYERERAGERREPAPRLAVREETDAERARRLAKRYDFTEAEVLELRKDGLEWADVEKTLDAARGSGHAPAEVAELRRSGLDYDEIVIRLGNMAPAEERPAWDSPSNPATREQWRQQQDWRLYRSDPGFPAEQLEDNRERPSR